MMRRAMYLIFRDHKSQEELRKDLRHSFQSCAFNRSAISPDEHRLWQLRRKPKLPQSSVIFYKAQSHGRIRHPKNATACVADLLITPRSAVKKTYASSDPESTLQFAE